MKPHKKKTGARRGNPIGQGMVYVSTQIPATADRDLRAQATAAGLSRCAYAGLLLVEGLKDPITVQHVRASGKVIYSIDHATNPTARDADDTATA
jgi:hypothetical protein